MQKLRLFAIDDDDLILQSIRMSLPEPWSCLTAKNWKDIPKGESFDAALVDIHLSGDIDVAEGISVIGQIRKQFPHIEIIAISGNLDRNNMEACLKQGASRFLPKPLGKEELGIVLGTIENLQLLKEARNRSSAPSWIGSGKSSQKILRQVAEIGDSKGPILIEGESGTGKEVVARLLHNYRSDRPLVVVNAAAIPESIFESEFFGHVKGAFTGADQNKIGLAEAAHDGDLFIDEIEALPLSQQAKLLRFLESGEIRKVGAKQSMQVQVRLITASNRNLQGMVQKEQFREDLYWRISGQKIQLSPLRDRPEDIEDLSKYFLSHQHPHRNKKLSEDALEELKRHGWPGNIRELKRVIERLCINSPLPIIRADDVKKEFFSYSGSSQHMQSFDLNKGLTQLMAEYERDVIRYALENIKDLDETVKVLQISRSSLYKKIKDHKIGAQQ